MEWPPAEAGIGDLSDDLLCRVFGELDSTQLRLAAGTCQRWAALLKNCEELWHRVSFALPPKKSRGRDRWGEGGTQGWAPAWACCG